MKSTMFLAALVTVGVVGCSSNTSNTSNEYKGTAPGDYGVITGQGSNQLMNKTNTPNYPPGQWYLWRYKGITPTTP
jgi:hypothetical protein